MSKKIEEVVKAKGLEPYEDKPLGWTRDLTKLHADWTANGAIETDEDACNFMMANSPETKGMTYHSLQKQPQRFVEIDEEVWNRINRIETTLDEIFSEAGENNESPVLAAKKLVERVLAEKSAE